jgi:hypothetical protein
MDDKRIVRRTPFRFEDSLNRSMVASVGPEPIYGFRRKRDSTACPQQLTCLSDSFSIRIRRVYAKRYCFAYHVKIQP